MLEIIQLVVVVAVAGLMTHNLSLVVRKKELREDWVKVMRGIRWWMLPAVLGALAAMITVVAVLWVSVPVLTWGWWSAIGGSGNLLLGQTGTTDTSATGDGGGGHIISLVLGVLGMAIPVAVLALVPLLALAEERKFRSGTADYPWWRVLTSSLGFGLVHLIVGIPIAVGLGLTVAGLVFHGVYRRARSRRLAGLETTRPERLAALPETVPSAAHLKFEAEYLWLRDELAADDHGTYVAASFHALWNLLLICVLIASLVAVLLTA